MAVSALRFRGLWEDEMFARRPKAPMQARGGGARSHSLTLDFGKCELWRSP